jgi:dipeptidyl aminopeptidase/acylaminoacyl peptidase
MLVHGRKDHIVPVEQTIAMAQALQAAGVPARTILVDNADHMLLRWQGAKLNPPLEEIDRQVIEFLRENLGN